MRLNLRKFSIVFSLFLCGAFFIHRFPQTPNPNEYSRIYQIRAVVETGHLYLDEIIERHGHLMDKSTHDGRYYSDKSFGLTLLGIPFYALYYFLFGSAGDNEWLKYFLSVLCVLIPNILFIWFLYGMYIEKRAGRSFKEMSLLAYMLGTIVFTYSSLFYSHVAGAVFCAFGFMIIEKKFSNNDFRLMPLLGLMLGMAVIIEFPLFLISLWLILYAGFYVWRRKKFRSVFYFAGCFLIPVLIQLAVNYLSFGDPFSLGYAKKSSVEQVYYHSHGLFGVSLPSWESFFGILFSPSRGLFYFSPFLIFAILVLIKLVQERETRVQGIILAGIFCTYTLFSSSVFDWQAGWTVGPRYYLAVIPFLLIALLKGEKRLRRIFNGKHRFFCRTVFLSLVIFSMFHCIFVTAAFPFVPEAFKVPFWEFSLPLLKKGYGSLSLFSLLGLNKTVSVIVFFCLSVFLLSLTYFLKLRLYKRNFFLISFIAGCFISVCLVTVTKFLPESDILKKSVKMEYIYHHWDKPVDQLEQLYIIDQSGTSFFDYKMKLADTLKKLGFYRQAGKHYEDILRKSPSNLQAMNRKDIIESVLKSGENNLQRIKTGKNSPNSKDDVLNEVIVLVRHGLYGDAQKVIDDNSFLLKEPDKPLKQMLSALKIIKKYDSFL